MSNFPILYINVMDGLPSGFAREIFLWAVERPGEDIMCYRAETFAREVDALFTSLTQMMDAGARIHGRIAHDPDLVSFILKRHANWKYGGNQTPPYA